MAINVTFNRATRVAGTNYDPSDTANIDESIARELVSQGDAHYTTPPAATLPVRTDIRIPAAQISDSTAAGQALITAASVAAQRVALGNLKEFVAAPASASAAGTAGQWAVDASYVYVCTATNTWKRTAISTW